MMVPLRTLLHTLLCMINLQFNLGIDKNATLSTQPKYLYFSINDTIYIIICPTKAIVCSNLKVMANINTIPDSCRYIASLYIVFYLEEHETASFVYDSDMNMQLS